MKMLETEKKLKNDIMCPLVNRGINTLVCEDMQLVAEQAAPAFTAPDEMTAIPNYMEICLACKNHFEE